MPSLWLAQWLARERAFLLHLASKVGRDHYWSVRRAVVVDGVHQYCSPRGAVVLCMRSSIGRYCIVMEV